MSDSIICNLNDYVYYSNNAAVNTISVNSSDTKNIFSGWNGPTSQTVTQFEDDQLIKIGSDFSIEGKHLKVLLKHLYKQIKEEYPEDFL